MEILGKLFGSANKVKIMRLFLLNPDSVLSGREVASRCKITLGSASRELKGLSAFGFVSKRARPKVKNGGRQGWQLESSFPFISQLKGMLKNDLVVRKRDLIKQFAGCGKINLFVISGIFIEDSDSRADLLLVGNNLKKKAIERVIKNLEAEIGKELVYAILDTSDFVYRLNACDRFVRDVLDYPHERLVDRLNVIHSGL